jgi:hypothetical protein
MSLVFHTGLRKSTSQYPGGSASQPIFNKGRGAFFSQNLGIVCKRSSDDDTFLFALHNYFVFKASQSNSLILYIIDASAGLPTANPYFDLA